MISGPVTLTDDYVARCLAYGDAACQEWVKPGPASRIRSTHGSSTKPLLQAEAKMAEVAACLTLGVDPETLHWDHLKADHGCDILFRDTRLDVKHARLNSQYLIWPMDRWDIFEKAEIDVLLGVRGEAPTFTCYGWVTKVEFAQHHSIAGPDHCLSEGTRCLKQKACHRMDTFLTHALRRKPTERNTRCHCGKWATRGMMDQRGQVKEFFCADHAA